MYMTPELVAFLLGILIPKLEEVAVLGKENRPRLVPFRFFRKKDWKIFTIILNEMIKNQLVKVKLDEYGKIEEGSTVGMTTVTSRELRYVMNGKLVIEHDEEWLGWQTLMRMNAFHQGTYHEVFREKSLELVCIALGYEGIRGLFKDEDIDPWLFLSF
jgi:hypothetical protein